MLGNKRGLRVVAELSSPGAAGEQQHYNPTVRNQNKRRVGDEQIAAARRLITAKAEQELKAWRKTLTAEQLKSLGLAGR